jgi:aryl sulfotransferase
MQRSPAKRYQSPDEDSARWLGFPLRPGDIIISTRSKSGTTWTQMICALLIFQSPVLPAPLSELSPWMDWLVEPVEDVFARLAAQPHRRFIKTHTPLDGIPLDEQATYLVVARDPLDAAVSLYHHGDNMNRQRLRELTGQPEPARPRPDRPPLHDWLVSWVDDEANWSGQMDSLPGVMWHLSDAWSLRHEPNVTLVHYADLLGDLEGQMRRLAGVLGVPVEEGRWPALVGAARFDSMQAQAERLVPDTLGVLNDSTRFFRHGTSGDGRGVLSGSELARYQQKVARLGPPDLVAWLQR